MYHTCTYTNLEKCTNTDKRFHNSSSLVFPTILIHLIVNTNRKLNTIATCQRPPCSRETQNLIIHSLLIFTVQSGLKCYSKLVFPPTALKKFVESMPATVPFCKE